MDAKSAAAAVAGSEVSSPHALVPASEALVVICAVVLGLGRVGKVKESMASCTVAAALADSKVANMRYMI